MMMFWSSVGRSKKLVPPDVAGRLFSSPSAIVEILDGVEGVAIMMILLAGFGEFTGSSTCQMITCNECVQRQARRQVLDC